MYSFRKLHVLCIVVSLCNGYATQAAFLRSAAQISFTYMKTVEFSIPTTPKNTIELLMFRVIEMNRIALH